MSTVKIKTVDQLVTMYHGVVTPIREIKIYFCMESYDVVEIETANGVHILIPKNKIMSIEMWEEKREEV